MPASFFISPNHIRAAVGAMFALLAGLGGLAQAAGPLCTPVLAFKEAHLSGTQLETMERRWTALVSVDASRCASTTGRFEILFTRQKENAPETDFAEQLTWSPGLVEVSVDFWADEAVEAYRLGRVAACPCRE